MGGQFNNSFENKVTMAGKSHVVDQVPRGPPPYPGTSGWVDLDLGPSNPLPVPATMTLTPPYEPSAPLPDNAPLTIHRA